MKNRFALTVAILGFATLICVLLFSRDTKLQYQNQPAAKTADPGTPLSPTILTLAEAPAPAPAPAAEVPKDSHSQAEAPKAKD